MTSAALQWVALLTMAVDHVGYALFPEVPALRAVGRLSFPVFAFLLAQGFAHTSNLKKYTLRILAFAVAAEVPYQLFLYGGLVVFPASNILFALALALGALWCVQQGGAGWLGAAGFMVMAQLGGFSYGAYGVALAVLFYLTRKKRALIPVVLTACTLLYCAYRHSLFQIWAIGAAVPLFLYNGERGHRLPRYFLYIFYPAHLCVLVAVRALTT